MSKQLIPKIIHQICLTNRPIQLKLDSWKQAHPDWEYHLWTKENLPAFINKKLFDSKLSNFQKEAILSIELLNHFGGIYVNAYSECLKPLDPSFLRYQFFAAYENERARPGLISHLIIGCVPGHLILKKFMSCLYEAKTDSEIASLFTKTIREFEVFHKRVMILPSHLFFPVHYSGVSYRGRGRVFALQQWSSEDFHVFDNNSLQEILKKNYLKQVSTEFSNPVIEKEIRIQPDYWEGTKCLEYGVPWQVPDSIYKEAEHCTKKDLVLEIGSGGSTIFLAKRCKHVVVVETDRLWAEKVMRQLTNSHLKNVTFIYISNQRDIELFLRNFNSELINIFSVDTAHGFDRSALVDAFLEKGISKHLHMMILDNYGDPVLHPFYYDKNIIKSDEWEVFTYDDTHWVGFGTKLYIKKKNH